MVTNSVGLMLVSWWAGINSLVQNKFRSTIHLLSQHLLALSHQWKRQMNVWQQIHQNDAIEAIMVFLLLTSNTFHILL